MMWCNSCLGSRESCAFNHWVYCQELMSVNPFIQMAVPWKIKSLRTGFIDDFALKDVTHQSSAVLIRCFVKCTKTIILIDSPHSFPMNLPLLHTHTHCTHARPRGKSTTSVPWGTNNHILPCCSQFCRIYSTNICDVTTMQGWGCCSCVWVIRRHQSIRKGGPLSLRECTTPLLINTEKCCSVTLTSLLRPLLTAASTFTLRSYTQLLHTPFYLTQTHSLYTETRFKQIRAECVDAHCNKGLLINLTCFAPYLLSSR